jgi:hypothetical protein
MNVPHQIIEASIQATIVIIAATPPIVIMALRGCLQRIEAKLDRNTALTQRSIQLSRETQTTLNTRDREHRRTDANSAPDATEERPIT